MKALEGRIEGASSSEHVTTKTELHETLFSSLSPRLTVSLPFLPCLYVPLPLEVLVNVQVARFKQWLEKGSLHFTSLSWINCIPTASLASQWVTWNNNQKESQAFSLRLLLVCNSSLCILNSFFPFTFYCCASPSLIFMHFTFPSPSCLHSLSTTDMRGRKREIDERKKRRSRAIDEDGHFFDSCSQCLSRIHPWIFPRLNNS